MMPVTGNDELPGIFRQDLSYMQFKYKIKVSIAFLGERLRWKAARRQAQK
jgi:hypothetical protein